MFLSMRGETELALIEEASISDEKDPNALSDEIVKEIADGVFNKWKLAQTQVVEPADRPDAADPGEHPAGPRPVPGRTTEKLECTGCHGPLALGDGPSFVEPGRLQRGRLRRQPQRARRRGSTELDDEDARRLWNQKPDDWGNPLRPANLNRGIYKGGRRPIDIFWRIAKGINGAQMPAHYPSPLDDKKIWDLVNFVLALPYEPELLEGRTAPPPATGPAVASADVTTWLAASR